MSSLKSKEISNVYSAQNSKSDTLFVDSPWHITNILRRLDRFGQPIPAFNMKGKDSIKTVIGGVLTAAIITLTLGYFIIKLQDLMEGTDKTVNYNVMHSYYDNEGLNLYQAN